MTTADVKIGPLTNSDGAVTTLRGERTGSGCVVFGHACYSEPSSRGNVMTASNAAAGVAPGTALSTTPPLAIWNPVGSGVNLHIHSVSVGYVSGTLGPGSIVYGYVPSQGTVPTTGTEITPVCNKLGAPRGIARAFTGSTVNATPLLLKPAFIMGAFVGGANNCPAPAVDIIDGAICVQPGSVFVIQGVAGAGTSPLVILSATWEEVPQ